MLLVQVLHRGQAGRQAGRQLPGWHNLSALGGCLTAAVSVLVQVSDFGLSRALDYEETHVRWAGGRARQAEAAGRTGRRAGDRPAHRADKTHPYPQRTCALCTQPCPQCHLMHCASTPPPHAAWAARWARLPTPPLRPLPTTA